MERDRQTQGWAGDPRRMRHQVAAFFFRGAQDFDAYDLSSIEGAGTRKNTALDQAFQRMQDQQITHGGESPST